MVSMSACYAHGQEVWQVVYDCSWAPSGLAVSGHSPPDLAEIRRRLSPDGDETTADAFDIPIELAKAVRGYRKDTSRYPWGELTYVVAEPAQSEVGPLPHIASAFPPPSVR